MSSSSSAACCGFEAFTFFFSAYFFPCLSRDVKISISILARARISKRSSREMTYRESREDFWFQQLSLSLSWCSARARARGVGSPAIDRPRRRVVGRADRRGNARRRGRERTLRALADERSGERVGRDVAHHLEPGGDRVVVPVARAHPPPGPRLASRDPLECARALFSRTLVGDARPDRGPRSRIDASARDRSRRAIDRLDRTHESTPRRAGRSPASTSEARPDRLRLSKVFRPLGVERTSGIVRHPVLKDEGATTKRKVPATRRRVRGGEKRGFANRQKKKRACRFSRLSVRVVGNFGASDGSFLGVAGVGCWVPRLFSARFPRTFSIASARARRRSSARGGTGVFRVPSFPRWRTESYGGTCSPPRRACSFARSVRSWCSSSCP